MPQMTRGQLNFEIHDLGAVESSGKVIEIFDCQPKPGGSHKEFKPTTTFKPSLSSRFLQDAERTRIEKFAAKSGETLEFPTVLEELEKAFKYSPLNVTLSNRPQDWKTSENCMSVTMMFKVVSRVIRIDVTAAADIKDGAVTYPKSDIVASFQIVVPDQYYFIRHAEYNPKCCPDKADKHPASSKTSLHFPIRFYKGLDLENWKLSPGMKWDMDGGLKLYPGVEYPKFSPLEEDEEPQPLPRIKPNFGF